MYTLPPVFAVCIWPSKSMNTSCLWISLEIPSLQTWGRTWWSMSSVTRWGQELTSRVSLNNSHISLGAAVTFETTKVSSDGPHPIQTYGGILNWHQGMYVKIPSIKTLHRLLPLSDSDTRYPKPRPTAICGGGLPGEKSSHRRRTFIPTITGQRSTIIDHAIKNVYIWVAWQEKCVHVVCVIFSDSVSCIETQL